MLLWGVKSLLLSAIRTTGLFLAVTLVMRMMGKRQVGEMQPYELVIMILIAELAAIPMENTDIPLVNGIIPIVILLVLQITLSEIALYSERARTLICGTPSILIAQGQIMEDELRKLRINLNDLLEQLRNSNFPNVKDVAYAILETNGQLSIIPKAGQGPITGQELNIFSPSGGLPINLILDGQLNLQNLQLAGLAIQDIETHARARGIRNLSQIFFANIDETGYIHIQAKARGQ